MMQCLRIPDVISMLCRSSSSLLIFSSSSFCTVSKSNSFSLCTNPQKHKRDIRCENANNVMMKKRACSWPPSVDKLPGSHSRTCAWPTPDTALCRYLIKTEIHTTVVNWNGQCVWLQVGPWLFLLPATLVRTCMFSSSTARGSRYSAARPASTSASLLFTWLRRSQYSLYTYAAVTMTKAIFLKLKIKKQTWH